MHEEQGGEDAASGAPADGHTGEGRGEGDVLTLRAAFAAGAMCCDSVALLVSPPVIAVFFAVSRLLQHVRYLALALSPLSRRFLDYQHYHSRKGMMCGGWQLVLIIC